MSQFIYKSIGEDLIKKIPEFKNILAEHKEEYGEILPHVLFGDFTRFVIEHFVKSQKDPKSKIVLQKSLELIEQMLSSDDQKIKELATVSFLENLHQAGENYKEIKKLLGKLSLRTLLKIEKNI